MESNSVVTEDLRNAYNKRFCGRQTLLIFWVVVLSSRCRRAFAHNATPVCSPTLVPTFLNWPQHRVESGIILSPALEYRLLVIARRYGAIECSEGNARWAL